MVFSKAVPEAFHITLFNGNRDNDRSKESQVFAKKVNTGRGATRFASNCEILILPTNTCGSSLPSLSRLPLKSVRQKALAWLY